MNGLKPTYYEISPAGASTRWISKMGPTKTLRNIAMFYKEISTYRQTFDP